MPTPTEDAKHQLNDAAANIPVLFLGGAGLPAWMWDDVRADLTQHTDSAVVQYPRAHVRGSKISLADYADAAAEQAPWSTFAVVAHSSGGVVATSLLSRHPGRVAGILGIAAVIPRPGHSFVTTMPFPTRLVLGAVIRAAGTRPPAKAIRAMARGLPDAVADRIVADFDPESVRLYSDPAPARDLPAARGYLRGSDDEELPARVLRSSAETLQAAWNEELSTGHLPMLQDPAGVSRAVRRLLAAATSNPREPCFCPPAGPQDPAR
ncbi:MAG TPA: alpha/beta hydrolase [Propionibacteriaceae bacterium]